MHPRLVIAMLAISLALAPTAGGQPMLVVKMATTATLGSPLVGQLQRLAAIVEQRTAGLVLVKLFPSGRLGSDADLLAQTRSGSVQIYAGSFRAFGRVKAGVEALANPFLFDDYTQADEQLDGPVSDAVARNLRSRELMFAGWGPSVFQHWFTPGPPPESPGAFDSLPLLRPSSTGFSLPNESHPFAALGAVPVDHTFDFAARNRRWLITSTAVVARAAGYERAATHITQARDALEGSAIVISKRWFDGLPRRIQQALGRLPRDPLVEARKRTRDLDIALVERMRARGKHVARLRKPARARFVELSHDHTEHLLEHGRAPTRRILASLRKPPAN